MGSADHTRKRLLVAIVLALAVWGVLLAVGAYLGLWHQGPEQQGLRDTRRFWVVLGAVGLFLCFWGAALGWKARRSRSQRRRSIPQEGVN